MFKKLANKSLKVIDQYKTESLLKKIRNLDVLQSDYLFIFCQEKNSFSTKIFTLVSYELSIKNIPSVFLYRNDLISKFYPKLIINNIQVSNSLSYGKAKGDIESKNMNDFYFDWTIDIEKEIISTYSINFFPLILCTLRTIQRRYNVNFYNSTNKIAFNFLIKSCDLLLYYFKLLKDFSSNNNKKIRIVGFENNYIPNGVFHLLCSKYSNERDIEYIELRRGYISYFGKHHFRDSFITCTNLIKQNVSDGTVINKNDLNTIEIDKVKLDDLEKPLLGALNKKPFLKQSDKKNSLVRKMNEYKKKGKEIFVLFAHLFYDVSPNDSSPSFKDMCKWIELTINYFKKNKNLLLLKPHPAELNITEPKKIPNETLRSFLNKLQLTENIISLEPDEFSLADLTPYISCGLIWRSSVAMELTFLGIPCIIAGTPIYQALALNYVKNREHYFQLIDSIENIKVTESQKFEVAKYLYLLEKKHIHIDCIEYNAKLRKLYWNRKALRKYLKNGDEKIRNIVKNMLA